MEEVGTEALPAQLPCVPHGAQSDTRAMVQ
jgi:hypothetical protein